MNEKHTKKVIGVLGGIGSGKSTVAREFGKLGCAVIDADVLAHEVLGEQSTVERVVEVFGSEVLASGGGISRRKLAEKAFSSKENITALNKIIHGEVLSRAEKLISEYSSQECVKGIVIDAPLLAEVGWAERCDELVFVECSFANRLRRAQERSSISKEELEARENFQISLDSKAEMANNVVVNNSGFSAMAKQVAAIFTKILK